MAPVDYIGVTVIAGFLGSGKTTLLRRVVRDPALGPKVAVIVNELGALGLDEELIRSSATTAAMHVQKLYSGCICCTLRGDLISALLELASGKDRPPPEHVLIETSGAARASEVSYGVNAISFEAPVRTDAVVTLVDAYGATRAHKEQLEVFEDQVRTADVVLLNKADLVSGEEDRAALLSWLRPLAPRATYLWTEHAAVPSSLLLGAVPLAPSPCPLPQTGEGTVVPAASDRPPSPARGRGVGGEGGEGHAHSFTAVTVSVPGPLRRDGLEDLLCDLADRIFRIKGVVDVADEGGRVAPALVQAVGDRVEIDELGADSPLSRTVRRLIFIGAGPDAVELRQALLGLQVGGGQA